MNKKNYLVGTQSEVWKAGAAQQITFIVTADCNLRCKYCYITHKSGGIRMNFETAKRFIDYILDDATIKKQDAVVLDFIGGEPLLEVDLIDQICDYFKIETFKRRMSWYWNYRINICTNGVNYSDNKVQNFIKKNYGKIYVSITLDGTKEKHDMQRVFPNGDGSYDVIKKNVDLWLKQFVGNTKVTFASDDLPLLKESIIQLWNDGIIDVSANVVFEDVWKEGDDKIFENQLKALADYIIDNDLYDKYRCTLFSDSIGGSYTEDDLLSTSCGAGKMMALGPTGDIYPCMRYYDYSLNNKKGLIIGNIENGIDFDKVRPFETVMYKYQSDSECLNCEVATGCAFCQGFNYDEADTYTNFQRAKYICKMHKARVRANNYYFAKLYNTKGIKRQYALTQKKSMIFILDDNYTTFCSYYNNVNSEAKNKVMSIEMIQEGIRYAVENFRKPIFLHSNNISILDSLQEELCGVEALHIIPASCPQSLEHIRDYILTVDSSSIDCDLRKCKNVLLNIKAEEIKELSHLLNVLLPKVDRININILNLNKSFDLNAYETCLKEINKKIIFIVEKEGVLKEVSVLTDILFMHKHGGCKAGEDSITYAPDGMAYVCPAFYSERMASIGKLNTSADIKNGHLLTDDFAPLCKVCDAYHCENCKFINQQCTGEVNVSPAFQCKKAHVERKCSYLLQKELQKYFKIPNLLTEIDYDDPYEVLPVSGKNMGFYNCL